MSQLCSICKVPLSVENGYLLTKGRGAGRFHAYCDSCASLRRRQKYAEDPKRAIAVARDWQLRNPEKTRRNVKRQSLKFLYGLRLEDYEKMLSTQGGKCALCGEPPGKYKLSVDHDHQTGKIRELLCSGCNGGLGLLKDSPGLLRAAADYLEKHK